MAGRMVATGADCRSIPSELNNLSLVEYEDCRKLSAKVADLIASTTSR